MVNPPIPIDEIAPPGSRAADGEGSGAALPSLLARLGWDPARDFRLLPGGDGGYVAHGGAPLFFAARGDGSPGALFRLLRRGWSAGAPVSLLVGPEEIAVFDGRARPAPGAKPLFTLPARAADADPRFEDLARLVSRAAALEGAEAARASKAEGLGAEQELLDELDRQRALLLGCFPARRAGRARDALEAAIKGAVESALLARLCEDRGLDADPAALDPALGAAEAERAALSLQALAADLASPASPFDLSVMPIELLGRLHERFVEQGAPPPAQARARPRIRKSTGVYYTPDHVVRYIVRATVGELLAGRTPEQVAELRVLDPACGSGAFLLGAGRQLFAWHRDWYAERAPHALTADGRPVLFLDGRGEPRLTAAKRREIVKNNLYGVDIDPRAAELARRSLVLLAFDERSLEPGGAVPAETALDLSANVRCGDSLVSAHFDYQRSFPRVFSAGGFDVVLGNPPYVSYGGRQAVELSAGRRGYFKEHYESSGWVAAHSFFIERSAKLLSRGLVSFIVPDQIGHLEGYRSLRRLLDREGEIREVKYWGEDVFRGIATPSLTFVFERSAAPRGAPGERGDGGAPGERGDGGAPGERGDGGAPGERGDGDEPAELGDRALGRATRIIDADGAERSGVLVDGGAWTFAPSARLLDKLRRGAVSLRPYLADCGIRTTAAKKQVTPLARAEGTFLPVLEGKQIGRYSCAPPEVAVRFDTGAPVFRSRDEKYAKAAFLIRQTAAYPIVGPREHTLWFRNSLHALFPPSDGTDVRYLVALLNSKLLRFVYITTIREAKQRIFPQVKLGALGGLPIRLPRPGVSEERERHDRIVGWVDDMLRLRREARAEGPPGARLLAAEFEAIDARLDAEIFDLYELTALERGEIEAATAGLAPAP